MFCIVFLNKKNEIKKIKFVLPGLFPELFPRLFSGEKFERLKKPIQKTEGAKRRRSEALHFLIGFLIGFFNRFF